MGLADSAILCTSPAEYFDYYVAEMKQSEYSCPASEIPFSVPDWNEKWYNAVCRQWYKDQRENVSRGIISDLYPFAQSGMMGLTQCMPLLDQPEPANDPKFYGAFCVDLSPVDILTNFFPAGNSAKTRSLIFNTDEVFEKATRQWYFLGNDMILDSWRNKELAKSDFYKTLSIELAQIAQLDKDEFKMEIVEMEIEADKALLFQQDYVTWGEVVL